MELDQLRYFLAVRRCGNFTEAAREVHLSQPALSRSIQKLEAELGQPLFDRKPGAVTPTAAGELLAVRAEQVVNTLSEAKAAITDDGETGDVRIGVIPTIAPYFLPEFLATIRRRFPAASLRVTEDVTERLVSCCERGELDMLVLALPLASGTLERETLFDEELFLLLPAGHALAGRKRITLADIEELPFLLLGEAHCLSGNVLAFCQELRYQPLAVERTSQLATVQELVGVGHGISMVPAMAKRLDQAPNRVYASLSSPRPTRSIALAWNADRFESRLVGNVKTALREHAAQFAAALET